MWTAADLVAEQGKASMSSCLSVGEFTHVVMPAGTQEGLLDGKKAEVHMIIRTHGPAQYDDSTLLGEQLNSFNGGCATESSEGYDCENLQVVVHLGK